jgi:hypothetical protein
MIEALSFAIIATSCFSDAIDERLEQWLFCHCSTSWRSLVSSSQLCEAPQLCITLFIKVL